MSYNIQIISRDFDEVIKSHYICLKSDYRFAIEKLVPAVNRLDIQREKQGERFYDRLARDISGGCIMPPLTIALVIDNASEIEQTEEKYQELIDEKINEIFILDGIQRLNTLMRVKESSEEKFPYEKSIYANLLICESFDLLLYRMITLNNGQKPMTARHQIEIVASNMYDFDSLSIDVQPEKRLPNQRRKKGAFKKADLIKSYLAYLSKNTNIDNNKIIEDKMDQIIAKRIIDSDITDEKYGFEIVLNKISEFCNVDRLKKWFQIENNLIGFCAGVRDSLDEILQLSNEEFESIIDLIDRSIANINVSKIKVGAARRECVSYFFSRYSESMHMDEFDLTEKFARVV